MKPPETRAGAKVFDATGRRVRILFGRRWGTDILKFEEDPEATPDVPALRAGLIRLIAGEDEVGLMRGLKHDGRVSLQNKRLMSHR